MASLNLKSLVSKLNPLCRQSLEGAAGLCLSRTNYNVEIEHWLSKLTERTDSDFEAIARSFDINMSKFLADLQKTMDRFQTGNGRPPALSQNIVDLVREAWLIGSVEFGESQIRSGYLVLAMVGSEGLSRVAMSCSPELDKISYESLKRSLPEICADSSEWATVAAPSGGRVEPGGKATGPSKTPSLDQFTIDLTDRARKGHIDPVLGRDDEIRQVTDILCRRRQNNPILTGEPGVGKTAVAEGFALRIAQGDVPPALQNVVVRTLDLALLQAGAGVKGEFENRLKSVIEEVKSSPSPIILFIDEAHTMIGAGGQAGQGDAANLLKPALARGELRTIAATTWAEYKKYFERDAALARRFQVVNVPEPGEASATDMLRGLVATLEKHHKVQILSEAVEEAVKLSNRYISGRQLPDKAISLLDTTCARIGLSQNSTPPAVEACTRRLQQLSTTLGILEREMLAGTDHQVRIGEIKQQIAETEQQRALLDERWQKELNLVSQILQFREQLHSNPQNDNDANGSTSDASTAPAKKADASAKSQAKASDAPAQPAGSPKPPTESTAKPEELKAEIQKLESELKEIQGDEPLVFSSCDASAVAATVAAWTGIPVGRMVANEVRTIMNLHHAMEESVVGQSHALAQIAKSIQVSRAKLTDPSRPIGIFLLAGTSGVGKTETAITLAELLYGGEQNVTVLNMSEFKEEHKVSLLMGSPPGYIGYGEGGVLTEAVRRKPYSVLLLDEMEKAHPGVQDVFYQVFDKGHMKDGEGRDIDFKNTVIIMTSNAGTDLIMSLSSDPETQPSPEALGTALHEELLKTFKPAFLGRITVIPYFPLEDAIMRRIIRLKLGKVARRVNENYNAKMDYTDAVVDAIAARCTEVDTGARNVDKILNKTLLPELSNEFLSSMAEASRFARVLVDADESGFKYSLSDD